MLLFESFKGGGIGKEIFVYIVPSRPGGTAAATPKTIALDLSVSSLYAAKQDLSRVGHYPAYSLPNLSISSARPANSVPFQSASFQLAPQFATGKVNLHYVTN
jgi:hypothetical protein